MREEVKPLSCPFCEDGGEPELSSSPTERNGDDIACVVCVKCDAQGPAIDLGYCLTERDGVDEAIERWNTRIAASTTSGALWSPISSPRTPVNDCISSDCAVAHRAFVPSGSSRSASRRFAHQSLSQGTPPMTGSIAFAARMFDRIETEVRMPDPKVWPDCPLCKESVVKCECDPELYATAVYAARGPHA